MSNENEERYEEFMQLKLKFVAAANRTENFQWLGKQELTRKKYYALITMILYCISHILFFTLHSMDLFLLQASLSIFIYVLLMFNWGETLQKI